MKKGRQDKTLTEKVEVLDLCKTFPSNLSQYCASKRLVISRRLLRNLLKSETELRQKMEDGQDAPSSEWKRERKDLHIDCYLLEGFKFVRIKNTFVIGPILK